MRILHTADWHLGRNLEQYSRLNEQAAFLQELSAICRAESVDLLLVSGDLFDTYNPSAAAEALFYDGLEQLSEGGRRAVVVIAGNHDNPERLTAAAPLARPRGIVLLGYPDSSAGDSEGRSCDAHMAGVQEWIEIEATGPGFVRLRASSCDHSAVILTLPYPSESRLAGLAACTLDEAARQLDYSQKIGCWLNSLAEQHFTPQTVNLVAAHFYVQGGWTSDSERTLQLGSAMLVDPASLPASAQYIALGHLHRPQVVAGSPAPARYSGSPLAYSFSEAGYVKSVCLADLRPGEPAAVRTIALSSGKPLRRWQAREGLAQALSWIQDGRDAGCWIDLEISTDHILTAAELKVLYESDTDFVYIRPVLTGPCQAGQAAAGRSDRKIDELFAEFYRTRFGIPVPEAILGTFLDLVNQAPEDEP